jgi:hypothetical protein
MSRNTLFIEDVLGAGWENEVGEDARIEPREPVVRGLTPSRYMQLWGLFPDEPHNDILYCLGQGFDVARTAEMVGLSPRQVKNSITTFLSMAKAAFSQPSFLPPPRPVASSLYIERRPKSHRGRPPKGRKSLPAPAQMQIGLPF